MTLNKIQLTEFPKPPAVCTKPLSAFVFPRYSRPHQFLGGSPAPVLRCANKLHAFFISNTFINMSSWNWQKIKQKLSNTVKLNFCFLKFIHFHHASYLPKSAGDNLKNIQKQVGLFNEVINDNENEAENEE